MTLTGKPKDLDITLPAVTEYANTAPSYFWEIKKAILSEVNVLTVTNNITLDVTHSVVQAYKATPFSITLPPLTDVAEYDSVAKRYKIINAGAGAATIVGTMTLMGEVVVNPVLQTNDIIEIWGDGLTWRGSYLFLTAANKKVWDGAAWRNASATPAANTVPVSSGDGDLNDWVSGLFPFTKRQFTNAVRQVVTLTLAAPCVATKIGHGYSAGDPIVFSTTGTLPTGVESEEDGTIYYVLAPAADTFTFAATPGGTAINGSVSQSGTHKVQEVDLFTIPTGITRVWAFMRGGGAGGSGGTDINFGGGGGGAGYPVFWYPIDVTPGDVLYHVNGNGGLAGGYQAAGAAGGSTWIGKVGTGKISVDAGGGQPGGIDKTGGPLGALGVGGGSAPSVASGGAEQADYIDGPMFNQFARTGGMASGATATSTGGGNGGGPGGGVGGADNNHGSDGTANSGSGGGGGGAHSGTSTAGGSGAYGYAWLAYW